MSIFAYMRATASLQQRNRSARQIQVSQNYRRQHLQIILTRAPILSTKYLRWWGGTGQT
jgi:hypothetical protein